MQWYHGLYIFLGVYLLFTLSAKSAQKEVCPLKSPTTEEKIEECWITIFIHGIMSIKPHVNLTTLYHLFCDQVEDTVYAKTVALMRNNPFFYKNQAMQSIGLQQIDLSQNNPGDASSALANIFKDTADAQQEIAHSFYTFGWSGIISHQDREKAGLRLYHALVKEIKKLKQKRISPKIRVIGYSHGGNVAMNMALAQPKDFMQHPYSIDELILIGTPIQGENDHLIESNLFKKVYNVYSTADRIQALDFFSKYRFFSHKIFKKRKNFSLPKKLTQIQIRTTDTLKGKKIAIDADNPNQSVVSGQARFLRDRSPGHAELWFFGWTPENYRKNFPLYPLPIVAVLPYILKGVKCNYSPNNPEQVIIADVRPDYCHIILRTAYSYTKYAIAPFPSSTDLQNLATKIKCYTPETYTKREYKEHMATALKLAQQEYASYKKRKKQQT